MEDFKRFRAQSRFGSLDGLRAISIILVITVHQGTEFWTWVDGSLGVVVFFVLSGFLITTLALREERNNQKLHLRAFYVRRMTRIFPAYYVTLALYCGVVFLVGGQDTVARRAIMAEGLPYYLLYLNEFVRTGTPFGQSWSLGVEEKFYLVWPLLAFVFMAGRPGPRRALAPVLAIAMWIVPGGTTWKADAYGDILVGCAIATLLDHPRWFRLLSHLGRDGIRELVVLAFLVLQFAPAAFDLRRSMAYPVAVALVLCALLSRPSRLSNYLATPALAFIGTRSYGMYLIHTLVRNALERVPLLHGAGTGAVIGRYVMTVACSLAFADLMYRTVEGPMIGIGRRWSHRLIRKAAASAGTQPAANEAATGRGQAL